MKIGYCPRQQEAHFDPNFPERLWCYPKKVCLDRWPNLGGPERRRERYASRPKGCNPRGQAERLVGTNGANEMTYKVRALAT